MFDPTVAKAEQSSIDLKRRSALSTEPILNAHFDSEGCLRTPRRRKRSVSRIRAVEVEVANVGKMEE
jgi:hypothetical protein